MQLPFDNLTDPANKLTLLTFNTNDEQVSESSPSGWGPQQQRECLVREVAQLRPDLLCLQEVMGDFKVPGYTFTGQFARSHRGACCTYLQSGAGARVLGQDVTGAPRTLPTRKRNHSGSGSGREGSGEDGSPSHSRGRFATTYRAGSDLPRRALFGRSADGNQREDDDNSDGEEDEDNGRASAAAGALSNPAAGGNEFVICNMHLAPFDGNGEKRLRQVGLVLGAAQQLAPDVPVILCGDMNMRESETTRMLQEYELQDAWLDAGAPQVHASTWDTTRNLYYQGGRQYTARYDRIMWPRWCEMAVRRHDGFRVVMDRPASQVPVHFLSDHFGLLASLTWES